MIPPCETEHTSFKNLLQFWTAKVGSTTKVVPKPKVIFVEPVVINEELVLKTQSIDEHILYAEEHELMYQYLFVD
ncbi:hypothetical protein COBT_001153, partial [Conglomerata obtusa]